MIAVLLLATATAISAQGSDGGFVEEISCSADGLTVQLNKTEAGLAAWMRSPNTQPIVYVYGHKNRSRCGMALKGLNGLAHYNLTIPYGPICDLQLNNLEGNDHQQAETYIAMEDNNNADASKHMRIHHVFCLYTRQVQTMKLNTISRGHQIVASKGGRPMPKVSMVFKTKEGKPIRAAKFGDEVAFYLSIDPDNAYKAILPRKCMFSDREAMNDEGAKKLTFVESHCPVEGMAAMIPPLEDIDEQVYHSSFRTFRFGNKSTLYAHCSVEVCLEKAQCQKACFGPGTAESTPFSGPLTLNASTAQFQDTPDLDVLRPVNADTFRLRRRFQRDTETSELALTHALTILDDEETAEIAWAEPSGSTGREREAGGGRLCFVDSAWTPFHFLLVAMAASLLVSVTAAVCLANKLRKQTKDLEARALVSASPSSTMYSHAYGGPLSLPRSHMVQGSAEFVEESIPDSNRSVSEMTVRPAWPAHSIPRLPAHDNKYFY